MLNVQIPLIDPAHLLEGDGSDSPVRPVCKCGRVGPTIGGRCAEHMTIHDEGLLMTVSAEDVLALAAEPGPKPGL